MKIDARTRFPHPVLGLGNGDYLSGDFKIDFSVIESVERSEVALEYTVTLTEPAIRDLITHGEAGLGIFVTCRDTFYNRLIELGLDAGRLAFEPGALVGRVIVRPLIWNRKQITASLANCHPEFGGGSMVFETGAVLALDRPIVIPVGREKLAQMETIFTIVKADELQSGTLSVNLDADKIRVLVAADIYNTVNSLRELPYGRPIILNSVYLPAVMQVLDSLRDGASQHEGRRWFKVVEAKCQQMGIKIEDPDLWDDAQKLLRSPFRDIYNSKELVQT